MTINITSKQFSLQRSAITKLMDLQTKEEFLYVKKISLIACAIIFCVLTHGIVYGTFLPITAPLLLVNGALTYYYIKQLKAESLDIQHWKPICEDILAAKYDPVLDKLHPMPINSTSLVFRNMYGKKTELNRRVMALQVYVLDQVFPKDNKKESFESVKARVIDRLLNNDKVPHKMLDVVRSMSNFPSHLIVVKSKIHFVLINVLSEVVLDHSKLNEKKSHKLFSSLRHSCKTARRCFREPLSPLDIRLLNSIENCSSFADLQKVAEKVTLQEKREILHKAF